MAIKGKCVNISQTTLPLCPSVKLADWRPHASSNISASYARIHKTLSDETILDGLMLTLFWGSLRTTLDRTHTPAACRVTIEVKHLSRLRSAPDMGEGGQPQPDDTQKDLGS